MSKKKFESNVIVLEGLPCSGKTTISSKLARIASKHNETLIRLPEFSNSSLGRLLFNSVHKGTYKALPQNTQRFLFLADRCYTFSEMLKLCKENEKVILDRSVFSIIAFQLPLATGIVPSRTSIKNFISAIEIVGGEKFFLPKNVVLIDIEPTTSFRRGLSKDAFSYKELVKIRETYLRISELFHFKIISGEEEFNIVQNNILDYSKSLGWFNW